MQLCDLLVLVPAGEVQPEAQAAAARRCRRGPLAAGQPRRFGGVMRQCRKICSALERCAHYGDKNFIFVWGLYEKDFLLVFTLKL